MEGKNSIQEVIKNSPDGLVAIIAGSPKDDEHVRNIQEALGGTPNYYARYSGHKNTEELLKFVDSIEKSPVPVVYITVAGRSNALSGIVAANTKWPVIACPPFKDMVAYSVDIHSSLRMPSETPVGVVVEPGNAALYAQKILRLATYYRTV